jgi:hypothetical protein
MNRKEWMLCIMVVLVVVRTLMFAYNVLTHSPMAAIELQALKMTAVVVVVLATCGFIFLPLLWERKQ